MERYDCPCKKKSNQVSPFAKSIKTRFDDDESIMSNPYRNLDKLKSKSRRESYGTIGDVVVEDTAAPISVSPSPIITGGVVVNGKTNSSSSSNKNTILIVVIIIAICIVVYFLWKSRRGGSGIVMPNFIGRFKN